MLVISTQYYDNYGDSKDPHWKAKGGSDYKIKNVPLNIDYEELVTASGIGYKRPLAEEHIIDWSIEPDDYLSWFEKSQINFDGEIIFPEPELDYEDIIYSYDHD
jgi:hypothetical protein